MLYIREDKAVLGEMGQKRAVLARIEINRALLKMLRNHVTYFYIPILKKMLRYTICCMYCVS